MRIWKNRLVRMFSVRRLRELTHKTTAKEIVDLTNEILAVMEEVKGYRCGECLGVDKNSPHYDYCLDCYDKAAAQAVASYLNANYAEDTSEIYDRLLEMGSKGAVAVSLLHTCCNDLHEINSSLPEYEQEQQAHESK